MGGQYLHSGFALPCPPGIDVPPESVSPFTSSNLKVCSYREHLTITAVCSITRSVFCAVQCLLLLGCFALFWSLFYTLEGTLTHWDWRGCGVAVPGRDRGSTGLEDSQVVQIQPEMNSESKVPLIAADENT